MQLTIHRILLRLLSQSTTWTIHICVELLCNIFCCAINNRFVWVLPLLLPLPVTSWSDSSLLLSRWMRLEVGVRAVEQHSPAGTRTSGLWWGNISQDRDGASVQYSGRTEQLTWIHSNLLLLLLLFMQIKSAVCLQVFPQGPLCPFLIAQSCCLNSFTPFKSSLNSPLSFLQFLCFLSFCQLLLCARRSCL